MANNPNIGGVVVGSIDIGGNQHFKQLLTDHAGVDVLGLVGATPAANTVLGRLKAIADALTAEGLLVDGLEGLATTNNTLATALNGYVDGIEGMLTALQTLATTGNTQTDGLEALATALNGYVDGLEAGQTGTTAAVNALGTPDYEAVAASAADQVLGATGAVGDNLAHVLITPTSLSPGPVSIKDGPGGAAIELFPGGDNSVTTLHPFSVPLGMNALSAGWRLTTGANVKALAVGNFT